MLALALLLQGARTGIIFKGQRTVTFDNGMTYTMPTEARWAGGSWLGCDVVLRCGVRTRSLAVVGTCRLLTPPKVTTCFPCAYAGLYGVQRQHRMAVQHTILQQHQLGQTA